MQADDSSAPPEDRQVDLAQAQQLNFVLSAIALMAAVCFWLGKDILHSIAAIVLALLPPILIYLISTEPLLYAFCKPKKDDSRTDLVLAFYACGFGLIVGNRNVHYVDWSILFECAGLIGLLFCVAVFTAARKNPQFWSTMLVTLVIAGAYGWGLTAVADSLTDTSAPAYYSTTVAGRYESQGRGTSYYLVLEPWGPLQNADRLRVSKDEYTSTVIGTQVCLELHPGLLHIPWYWVVTCNSNNNGQ